MVTSSNGFIQYTTFFSTVLKFEKSENSFYNYNIKTKRLNAAQSISFKNKDNEAIPQGSENTLIITQLSHLRDMQNSRATSPNNPYHD